MGDTPGSRGGAVALLVVAIVSVQLGASVAKGVFPLIGPQGMAGLRTTFAALILAAAWRPWRGPLSREGRRAVMLYGAVLGFMNLTFYLALQRIPQGVAVAIEFLGPLAVALAASRRPLDFAWAGLAALGLALMAPRSGGTGPLDPVGIVFAVCAAACWALYIVFGKRAGTLVHGGRATALGMATAALVTLPFAVAHAGTALLQREAVLPALLVAVLSSAVPYSLEMVALKRLPSQTFGILMSLEPALAALFGLLINGETLSLTQWTAIASVMVASAGSAATAGRRVGEALAEGEAVP